MDYMQEIINHLMESEGFNKYEAIECFMDMRQEVKDGKDPEDILYEIGLEPDYIWALI